MNRDERVKRLAAVEAATTFEAEQELLKGFPGIDLRYDLPSDRGKLWGLHLHDMQQDDLADYAAVVAPFKLPFERGARRHYVTGTQVDDLQKALEAAGFVIARAL